jgi:hypothetical protein
MNFRRALERAAKRRRIIMCMLPIAAVRNHLESARSLSVG